MGLCCPNFMVATLPDALGGDCCCVAFCDVFPVDNLPDFFEIVGTYVLVLEVVGVFPYVDAEEGNKPRSGLKRVLVGAGGDFETFASFVVSEPSTAGALDPYRCRIELCDEVVEGAELCL